MSYFTDRIKNEMRLESSDYTLKLKYSDPRHGFQVEKELSFLIETSAGDIEIFPFDIEGHLIEYTTKKDRKTFTDDGEGLSIYSVIRLAPENIKEGSGKYKMPKGEETHPFITPEVLYLYNRKKEIKTLYLTEGYLKAITASKHLKLPFIGLGSITLYKDKLGELYQDIKRVIEVCKVENVIMVYDGDTRDISHKALKDEKKDLSHRPYGFFNSALNLRNFLVDENVNFYFATVKSDTIEGNPKGIDDLVLSRFKDCGKIAQNLRKRVSDKVYFTKFDLSGSLSKLKTYLNLDSAKNFWEFHREKISYQKFTFFGTEYQYNYETDKLEIVMPEAATRYIRIGDDYFEKINKPTIHGSYNSILSRRMKSTIKDDHGPKVFKYISKYKDFIIFPSHEDYQEVNEGFYNLYKPLIYEPIEGEFPKTEMFLKHVFAELGTAGYDLALDYVQILFKYPTQILPILCLVSEENETGKTMFALWLNEIFKGNCSIIGNAEIESNFNGYLLGKLLVAIDESFLDKKLVIEKIKSMATAPTIPLTKKGKDTIQVDFFAKFLLMSNNVDNFITANENDIRYWVLTVPKIEKSKKDPDLLEKMKKEIPAFLYFLQKRTISTPRVGRAWFAEDLLKTDSLKRIINKSKPTAVRDLETELTEMFKTYRVKSINMCLKDVQEMIFNKRLNSTYVKDILQKHMKLEASEKPGKYKIPIGIDDNDELIIKKGNSTYYTFTPEMFGIDGTDFTEIENMPF